MEPVQVGLHQEGRREPEGVVGEVLVVAGVGVGDHDARGHVAFRVDLKSGQDQKSHHLKFKG